jgi:hypothetical protein
MSKKIDLIPIEKDDFYGFNFYKKYTEDKSYARPTNEDIMCETQLNSLSTHEKLRPRIDNNIFLKEVNLYKDKWRPYLQRPGFVNDREGLLLWGLEGDSCNDSLSMPEARRRTENPNLKESEFCYPTQFYKDIPCLHRICEYFAPLGRTYIVKANKGSFFPPHKDFPLISRDCFRIVCFWGNTTEYSWETDSQKLIIQSGNTYYVDTRKTHQTHMWGEEPSYHLIMNIPKTWKNVVKLMSICQK